MTSTSTAFRARVINDMYWHRHGSSLEILRADFNGDWPPRGLHITRPPEHALAFKTYSQIMPLETGYVENSTRENEIYINRLGNISALFNAASQSLARTIAHENIHILQKNLIKQGLCDPHGRFFRHGIKAMMRDTKNSFATYYGAEDELQMVLHEMVSRHYRRHGTIPLTKEDFWEFLHQEGAKIHGTCLKHPASAVKFSWFDKNLVHGLNLVLQSIRDDQKEKFSRNTLPALYGSLLELYGDAEGSRRLGYDHNITLTDLFFRQAWHIEHVIEKGMIPDMDKIKTIVNAMPESQKADMPDIVRGQQYTHPLSGRTLKIQPRSACLIAQLLPDAA